MARRTLAIDFGTSNSAAAVLDGGIPLRLPIEQSSETLPTAVFFGLDDNTMQIGTAAGKALIAGDEGRYMRALKSVLGTSLFHETRLVGGKRRTLDDIVTAFLVTMKQRAEAATGWQFTQVLSGRPVHFHSSDPKRDALAESDLRACYHAAGFDDVQFMFEPEAAALATHEQSRAGEIGLIVDIGGGTSDFSVFRNTADQIEIMASHGIRLGGTDFDQGVSMTHAMPLLGRGGQLRRTFGEGLLPVPNAIYQDLSTWAKIPFLYTRETQRAVDDLLAHAVAPQALRRLGTVITDQLGHELAFAVEKGKIAANAGAASDGINMAYIEPRLMARIDPASLDAALSPFRNRLREAMLETLRLAETTPDQIGTVILVGGSSLMRMVSDEIGGLLPAARLCHADAFTAVVDGLALATKQSPRAK